MEEVVKLLIPGTPEWDEAAADEYAGPIFEGMIREGLPISRERYIQVAFGLTNERWTPEYEAHMPKSLQDWDLLERICDQYRKEDEGNPNLVFDENGLI